MLAGRHAILKYVQNGALRRRAARIVSDCCPRRASVQCALDTLYLHCFGMRPADVPALL